jgi:hypothetical protein
VLDLASSTHQPLNLHNPGSQKRGARGDYNLPSPLLATRVPAGLGRTAPASNGRLTLLLGLVQADLVLGCTDTAHSRVGLSELAYRYLVPVIDVGVQLDGRAGRVECEVAQFVSYMPGGPCAFCCDLVNSWALAVELMSEEEREERRRQADVAVARGDRPDGYWRELPQLLTVGDFTTVAGALGANYAKGMLTGRFSMPAPFFQIDVLAPDFGFVGMKMDSKPSCACAELIGHADQGAHRQVITPPSHWTPARLTSSESL